MAKVRQIRVETPRIVQPGEGGLKPWLWLVFLLVLAAWSWQLYEFGRQQAGGVGPGAQQVDARLRGQLKELTAERDDLVAANVRLERSAQIDRAAANGVQAEIKALQDERAELKRELALLKALVSNGEVEPEVNNLRLDDHQLVDSGNGVYQFEVTLSKLMDDQVVVSGQAVVTVAGKVGEQERVLDMQTLTDGRRSHIGMRFKNYQKLRTELQVPADFVPQSILVEVKPEARGTKSFTQTYAWMLSDG